MTQIITGTTPYKAPELILNQPSDFKSDIWSLGVILYEILSGKMPFTGTNTEEVSQCILSKELHYDDPIW